MNKQKSVAEGSEAWSRRTSQETLSKSRKKKQEQEQKGNRHEEKVQAG